MYTLLLLLSTTQAPAHHDPHWVDYPAPKQTWCDRFSRKCERVSLAVSGVKCFYHRRGIPVSPGPTPTYQRYFQAAPAAPVVLPAPDGAPKAK